MCHFALTFLSARDSINELTHHHRIYCSSPELRAVSCDNGGYLAGELNFQILKLSAHYNSRDSLDTAMPNILAVTIASHRLLDGYYISNKTTSEYFDFFAELHQPVKY